MDVGPAELLIVLVIALVLFGGKKLPELAKSIGSAKKEYEKGLSGEEADVTVPDPVPATTVVETTIVETVAAEPVALATEMVDTTGTVAEPGPPIS